MIKFSKYDQATCFVEYAKMFIGQPYLWGGDDAIDGFDCSGLVVEALKAVGLMTKGDATANALFNKYEDCMVEEPQLGSLVCYAHNGRIVHIGIYWTADLYITADGGGSQIRTLEDAARHNAFVKVRPVWSRRDPIFLDIFKLRGNDA